MRVPRVPSGGLWLAVPLSLAAATYFVRHVATVGFVPAYDIYAYWYPKMLYAVESVRAGGRGLLWNPFQNCGQPFYALSQTGLLYPPHWLFLLVDPGLALRGVLIANQIVAGVGTYLLARQLGAGPAAAASGMLVLQLGTTLAAFTTLATPHLGAYAWLPVALLAAERLLAAPGAPRAVQLAAVLAVQWLAGSPQVWFLTLQLVGLRLLWSLVSRAAAPWRAIGWMTVGVALAPMLAGVQVLPEVEVARASVRATSLQGEEANPLGVLDRKAVEHELVVRGGIHRAVVPALLPIVLAAAAVGGVRHPATFYAAAGLLYGVLAFGPATPLFRFYLLLPGATMFRFASRLLWVTGFCFALLVAVGVQALGTAAAGRAMRFGPPIVLALLGLGFAAAELVVPRGLLPAERALVAVAAVATILAWRTPRWRPWLPWVLLAGIGVVLVTIPGGRPRFLFSHPLTYGERQPVLEALSRRLSPQERVYTVGRRGFGADYTLVPKVASLFRLRSAIDYEPLLSARYAELQVRLRTGHAMRSRREAIYMPEIGPGHSRRLLDLLAVRYLLIDRADARRIEQLRPPFVPRLALGDTLVFENRSALPRARYVPRVEVVPDPRLLLERLAAGPDDPRQVALVEAPPPSGFTGLPADHGPADVRFVRDEPERVELAVRAPARGFLVLSDQHDTGWRATVDGRPAPILRADHAFRLVEVPEGASTVVFRYRPRSLLLGVLASVAGLVVTAGILRWVRRRGERPREDAPAV